MTALTRQAGASVLVPDPRAPRAPRPAPGFAAAAIARARRALTTPRSPVFVVVALSAWLAATANFALWRVLWRMDAGAVTLALAAAFLFASTLLLLSATAWPRWLKPVWLAVAVAAAVSQHYMLTYGVVIDPTLLASVVETNASEARDVLGWALFGQIAWIALPPALWLVPLRIHDAGARRSAWRTLRLVGVALLLTALATAVGYGRLAPLVRSDMTLRLLPNPMTPIASAVRFALRPLARRPGALVPISAGAALGPSHAVATAKPPLLVLVVGETARADHFALNGYGRDTTPELQAAGALSFGDVWSCGTYTLASVPCMFSSLGRTRFAAQSAEHENLLDVAQAAGLAVLWLDNQAGCKGVCARVPSASTADLADAPSAPAQALCGSDGECLDEALLIGLDARIAALPAARRRNGVLVVMHQMGSHGPAYARRSAPAQKRFLPECTSPTFDRCDHAQLVNAYDNSIAYTDHVLGRTIAWLRTQSAGYAPALLYVSDHGESLGEMGVYLHGLPYAIAPEAQRHVPMVAWLSDDIARRDRLAPACLRQQLGAQLSHDNLYPTVLGLLDVRTPTYAPALDLWAPCRQRAAG